MNSPQQWRPAQYPPDLPSRAQYPAAPSSGHPAQAYGMPAANPEIQHGATVQGYPAQAYAPPYPVQPNINVTVAPTMQQSISVHGRRPPIRHGLHFVLTLLTGGLWLFVWIPLAMRRKG